jgi:hypothetical protein
MRNGALAGDVIRACVTERRQVDAAQQVLAVAARQSPDWEIAFAHAVLAHAAAAVNDRDLHARQYALAKDLGSALRDAEEREIFEATFARIPAPTLARTGAALER